MTSEALTSKGIFDLDHPLLNRLAESFVKATGSDFGAVQAVSREAYFTAVDVETIKKSLEAMVKNTRKESFQWGMAAGVYSGLTYGLREARGVHDWKNSAVAGAITGVALALASEDNLREQVVQFAITGAVVSTAADLLTGIF